MLEDGEDHTNQLPILLANNVLCSNVTIEGTKEDVFNHISQVHPAAAAAINETINAMTLAQNTESLFTHYDQGPYFCNLDQWARGNPYSIINGADYLMRVPGKPANAPGPGACGRVSCSDNAAIYWCNDVGPLALIRLVCVANPPLPSELRGLSLTETPTAEQGGKGP